MASVKECERALRSLVARLSDVDSDTRDRHGLERSLTCHVRDIAADFSGRLQNGTVEGLVASPNPDAQIKLAVDSDDLVALTQGQLSFGSAWATGRVTVNASVFDLLKLRALL
jgi:predicted lipid carrier protein YhbT